MIETIFIILPLMLSPGPANLVSFSLSSRSGLSEMFYFLAGIALVYAFVAIGLGFINNQIVEEVPSFAIALRLLGGLFIFYLGIQLIKKKKTSTTTTKPSFLNGILLQILNPKYPPVVLSVFAYKQNQPVLLTAGAISIIGIMGLMIYSTVGSLIHRKIKSEKWLQSLDVFFGILLILIALDSIVESIFGILKN